MISVFNMQMTSEPNVEQNLAFVRQQLDSVRGSVSKNIVVLPECFAYFGGKESETLALANPLHKGSLQQALADLAAEFEIYLVAGSIPVRGNEPNKFKNMCIVYSPTGDVLAHYQKIHLFDVTVADGTGNYRESDTAEPGNEIVTFEAEGIKVGIAICYDLRFAGLFQLLREQHVDLVVLPSAFTETTGNAHWHVLVQARAIENQYYMAACNQVGVHKNGRETFGHSIVVDPWGTILSDAKKSVGISGAAINPASISRIRGKMPVSEHNQIKCKLK